MGGDRLKLPKCDTDVDDLDEKCNFASDILFEWSIVYVHEKLNGHGQLLFYCHIVLLRESDFS